MTKIDQLPTYAGLYTVHFEGLAGFLILVLTDEDIWVDGNGIRLSMDQLEIVSDGDFVPMYSFHNVVDAIVYSLNKAGETHSADMVRAYAEDGTDNDADDH